MSLKLHQKYSDRIKDRKDHEQSAAPKSKSFDRSSSTKLGGHAPESLDYGIAEVTELWSYLVTNHLPRKRYRCLVQASETRKLSISMSQRFQPKE
jgi:hypothetical protein